MKQILKDLEESIYDCKLDAGDGGDNLDCISDAIGLLDKLKEALVSESFTANDVQRAYYDGLNDNRDLFNIKNYR